MQEQGLAGAWQSGHSIVQHEENMRSGAAPERLLGDCVRHLVCSAVGEGAGDPEKS